VVEYNKAPAVTRERMYLEAMQQVFTNVSKVMVDSKSNSNLLYLPLDKLLSQTAAGAPGAPGASTATGSMTAPQQTPAAAAPETPPAAADSRGNAVPSLRDRLREAR
jgi:membrane protease subunit HflK